MPQRQGTRAAGTTEAKDSRAPHSKRKSYAISQQASCWSNEQAIGGQRASQLRSIDYINIHSITAADAIRRPFNINSGIIVPDTSKYIFHLRAQCCAKPGPDEERGEAQHVARQNVLRIERDGEPSLTLRSFSYAASSLPPFSSIFSANQITCRSLGYQTLCQQRSDGPLWQRKTSSQEQPSAMPSQLYSEHPAEEDAMRLPSKGQGSATHSMMSTYVTIAWLISVQEARHSTTATMAPARTLWSIIELQDRRRGGHICDLSEEEDGGYTRPLNGQGTIWTDGIHHQMQETPAVQQSSAVVQAFSPQQPAALPHTSTPPQTFPASQLFALCLGEGYKNCQPEYRILEGRSVLEDILGYQAIRI